MEAVAGPNPADDLLRLYDSAVVEVHGYLARRCPAGDAEDITSETFMAAVDSIRRGVVDQVTTAWLMGIARHKLVDHWRRTEREQRRLTAVEGHYQAGVDPWDPVIDREHAESVLSQLSPLHRLVLTLKYFDGLRVAEIGELLERSGAGVEALLTRAKAAFRLTYEGGEQ